jgi:hypothetical protein
MLVLESSVRDDLKSICLKVEPYSGKLQKSILDNQFFLYSQDGLLPSKPNLVIRYYMALSMVTLNEVSERYRDKPNSKYHNLMSGHESLVSKILTNEYQLPHIRQLLIGSSHSDFYIPKYHLSIEPSSDRYFATPARSRAEEQSEFQRRAMNELVTLRTENYKATGKILKSVIEDYERRNLIAPLAKIKMNMYSMAIHTLPRFIPYKAFLWIIDETENIENLKIIH